MSARSALPRAACASRSRSSCSLRQRVRGAGVRGAALGGALPQLAVPMVLDRVVGAPGQALADCGPAVAQLRLGSDDLRGARQTGRRGRRGERQGPVQCGWWLRVALSHAVWGRPRGCCARCGLRTVASSCSVKGSCLSAGFSWLNQLRGGGRRQEAAARFSGLAARARFLGVGHPGARAAPPARPAGRPAAARRGPGRAPQAAALAVAPRLAAERLLSSRRRRVSARTTRSASTAAAAAVPPQPASSCAGPATQQASAAAHPPAGVKPTSRQFAFATPAGQTAAQLGRRAPPRTHCRRWRARASGVQVMRARASFSAAILEVLGLWPRSRRRAAREARERPRDGWGEHAAPRRRGPAAQSWGWKSSCGAVPPRRLAAESPLGLRFRRPLAASTSR